MNTLIYYLSLLFMTAVIVWAVSASLELLAWKNNASIFKELCPLIHSDPKMFSRLPPGYLITQGTYKNRKVICRLDLEPANQKFHYNLSLHCHMEPLARPRATFAKNILLTPHTRLDKENRIYYNFTSTTSIRSYLFSQRIPREDLIQILEELTRASELIESQMS